jgi:hypothetical protein
MRDTQPAMSDVIKGRLDVADKKTPRLEIAVETIQNQTWRFTQDKIKQRKDYILQDSVGAN